MPGVILEDEFMELKERVVDEDPKAAQLLDEWYSACAVVQWYSVCVVV